MARAFVGIGSNLGDRAGNIRAAIERLGELPETAVVRASTLIETDPVGGPEQGKYLNGVVELQTELEPGDLLDELLAIEADLGRVRTRRWGARTIDLDILLYDDRVIDKPGLTVPHPRMAEREFVLAPLAEIAPDAVDPRTGKTVQKMLAVVRGGTPRGGAENGGE